ncbi:MAG TPA: enoyl-CoA hydratase/isomerase family protein [Planctomycetota bacterium]|nr:enoyl-CoA hydratase/isomerase family protein [Planctomycetota bacterium]
MPAAESKLVRYRTEHEGRIAVLELNDPPLNGYTHEMMRALDEGILAARFDDRVDVIVLTGAGEKHFCVGANISMLHGATPRFKYHFCLHANETLSRLEQTPKLVLAALNGNFVGGGLEIALACDLRIARRQGGKDVGRTGAPEVNLGVLPGTGGTQRLVRLVGKARAIELMASGRLLDLAEAQTLGLVDRIVDAPDLAGWHAAVLDYARSFCAPGKASMAVGHIKRAAQSGAEIPLEYGLALERELQARLFSSPDAKEGIAAYVEKRTPRFGGNA